MKSKNILTSDYVRTIVFGIEDSLVSTIGLVSGVAALGSSRGLILITGTILVLVEAFSMAIGSLLSENSAREFRYHTTISLRKSVASAVIMFLTYFISGFIILLPYALFVPAIAFNVSVFLSLIMLFGLGFQSARLSGTPPWRKGILMVVVGGVAILIGILVAGIMQGFISTH